MSQRDLWIIASSGTDDGKTVVSGIVARGLGAQYWKPIQCGTQGGTDTRRVSEWIGGERCLPEAYVLEYPAAVNHAARFCGVSLEEERLVPPEGEAPLVVELAGGVLSPQTDSQTQCDFYGRWPARWIFVSRHYLGSISHTLSGLEALKRRGVQIAGIVFNGGPHVEAEHFIMEYSKVPCLGRVEREESITPEVIEKYVRRWGSCLSTQIHSSRMQEVCG